MNDDSPRKMMPRSIHCSCKPALKHRRVRASHLTHVLSVEIGVSVNDQTRQDVNYQTTFAKEQEKRPDEYSQHILWSDVECLQVEAEDNHL